MSPAHSAGSTAPVGVPGSPMPSIGSADTSTLMGHRSITETHVSAVMDTTVPVRYVEMSGEMRRGVTVLEMRGSAHDKRIPEFTIDGTGMHVGQPFRGIAGILSGQLSLPFEEERWSHPAQRDR